METDDYKAGLLRFLRENGRDTWRGLIALIGAAEAERLLRLSRREMIVQLAKSGRFTSQQLAELFGVSRQRIHQIAPYPKVFKGRRPEPYKLKACRALIAKGIPEHEHRDWLWNALTPPGLTQQELAENLGVSNQNLTYYLKSLHLSFWYERRGRAANIADAHGGKQHG